jgi:hypothetical protein
MFWYVTTFVAILAAIAFGWISFQTTHERFTVSLEIGRIRPAMAWLKEAATHAREKGHNYFEHSRES